MSSMLLVDHQKSDCSRIVFSKNPSLPIPSTHCTGNVLLGFFSKWRSLSAALSLGSLFPGGQTDITAATKALRQIANFILSAY